MYSKCCYRSFLLSNLNKQQLGFYPLSLQYCVREVHETILFPFDIVEQQELRAAFGTGPICWAACIIKQTCI